MTKAEVGLLLRAMKADGMSAFWIQLVADQGPRGRQIGARLYRTMPARFAALPTEDTEVTCP